jgi:uncharacterized protein (DUF885 family)
MTVAADPIADTPEAIAEDALQLLLAQSPLFASQLGYRQFDHAVPAVTVAAEDAQRAAYDDLLRRALALDSAALDPRSRVTRSLLLVRLREEIETLSARGAEMDVGVNFAGAQTAVLHRTPRLELRDAAAAEGYLGRLGAFAGMLDDAGERLRSGVGRGRVPTERAVHAAVREIDGYFAGSIQDDPLATKEAPAGWAGEARWRECVVQAVRQQLRPALSRYRDLLAQEVLPLARPDERCGLSWVPGGEELYAAAVRRHTTTSRGPQEIHELGLSLLGQIEDRVAELAPAVLGVTSARECFTRLREDPALRFSSREEMVRLAEAAMARSQTAARGWFGRLPAADCVVNEVPAHEAGVAISAWYQEPALDGSRPGTYWLNTADPSARTRFDAEAIAFHEAVPGHHLQIGLALEDQSLPMYRRLSIFTAYAEGWGLYAEQLADEGGLYSDDLQRLGLLSTAAMRACRLVVDTGLHALGWSRQRAVDLVLEHTAWAASDVEREVDRYLSWPGQALGYQVGCTEILRLRERARASMRQRFSLAGFHDAVLAHGSVPLSTLDELVAAYETAG